MLFDRAEILETLRMLEIENLDVRTVTLGISILDCRGKDFEETVQRVVAKIRRYAASLNAVADEVSTKYGIPIVNRRVAISPVALLLTGEEGEGVLDFAKALDDLARELAIDFIGGFSALVHKGATKGRCPPHGELALCAFRDRTYLRLGECGIKPHGDEC